MPEIPVPTSEEVAAFEAAHAAFAAGTDTTTVLRTQAKAMRDGLAGWIQTPVATRNPATAAVMEAQGKALTLASIGSTDETLIALTAEIGALAQIAREERRQYEEGLLA